MVTSLNVGGAERYLLRLVRFLVQRGWGGRIDVLCGGGQEGTLAAEFRELGAQVVPLRQSFFSPRAWWRVRRFLAASPYQAICDFSGDFAGLQLWLAATVGIPKRLAFYRGSTHHFRLDAIRLTYWRVMHSLTMYYATSLLSNSYAAFDFFCKGWRDRSDRRFEVIRNGIDAAEFDIPVERDAKRRELGIPEGMYAIGHLGRYNEAKNHRTILAVAEEMCRIRHDVVFLLCGRGVNESLRTEVLRMGLAERVLLKGNQDDVAGVLKSLDLFYFPSTTEGQPNALLEAMLAGVPFVASDIAPHREALPEWGQQTLVPPCDVTSATNKLAEMLSDLHSQRIFMQRVSEWTRRVYSPDQCFGAVLRHLDAGVSTEPTASAPGSALCAKSE